MNKEKFNQTINTIMNEEHVKKWHWNIERKNIAYYNKTLYRGRHH